MTKRKYCDCDKCTAVGKVLNSNVIHLYLQKKLKKNIVFKTKDTTIEEKLLLKMCIDNNNSLTKLGKKVLQSKSNIRVVVCTEMGMTDIYSIYIDNKLIQ